MIDEDDPPAPDPSEPIPARFLGRTDDSDEWRSAGAKELALARIRGIDRTDVLDEWFRIAEILDLVPGDREIVEALNRRRIYLREAGDRPESFDGKRSPSDPKDVIFLDEDGEPRSPESRSWEYRPTDPSGFSVDVSVSAPHSSEQGSLEAFADGGEEE